MTEAGSTESLWPKTLQCYDVTMPSPAENLALDEVLLTTINADPTKAILRFWQPTDYCVVLGRSNRAESEVNLDECRATQVPVLRRVSGGGAVVIGPGCLCYSLVIPFSGKLRSLDVTKMTAELMSRTAIGLTSIRTRIDVRGVSDLVADSRKVSGNAQRRLQNAFIHHGTLLFDFDITQIERLLSHPTKEPEYRESRRHRDFVTNLVTTPDELKANLRQSWNAVEEACPAELARSASELAASKYSDPEWLVLG